MANTPRNEATDAFAACVAHAGEESLVGSSPGLSLVMASSPGSPDAEGTKEIAVAATAAEGGYLAQGDIVSTAGVRPRQLELQDIQGVQFEAEGETADGSYGRAARQYSGRNVERTKLGKRPPGVVTGPAEGNRTKSPTPASRSTSRQPAGSGEGESLAVMTPGRKPRLVQV